MKDEQSVVRKISTIFKLKITNGMHENRIDLSTLDQEENGVVNHHKIFSQNPENIKCICKVIE